MDLIETLRSTGAVREFTDQPVPDEVVTRILDNARFAPSGANAQAWHVVLVKSAALRAELRDLYLPGWRDYLAMGAAGLRPWAPTNDPAAEAAALAAAPAAVTTAAAPENWAVAAVLALGHPVCAPRRLRRRPVSSFTTVDRIDGAALGDPPKPSGKPAATT